MFTLMLMIYSYKLAKLGKIDDADLLTYATMMLFTIIFDMILFAMTFALASTAFSQ